MQKKLVSKQKLNMMPYQDVGRGQNTAPQSTGKVVARKAKPSAQISGDKAVERRRKSLVKPFGGKHATSTKKDSQRDLGNKKQLVERGRHEDDDWEGETCIPVVYQKRPVRMIGECIPFYPRVKPTKTAASKPTAIRRQGEKSNASNKHAIHTIPSSSGTPSQSFTTPTQTKPASPVLTDKREVNQTISENNNLSSTAKPVVTDVEDESAFCDGYSCTHDVPGYDAKKFNEIAEDLSQSIVGELVFEQIYFPPGQRQYKKSFGLRTKMRAVAALFQYDPSNKDAHFGRYECKPGLLGKDGEALVRKILRGFLGDDYKNTLAAGNITRIDSTKDVPDIKPADVVLVSAKAKSSDVYHRAVDIHGVPTWELQTQSVGSHTSDSFAQVYDKTAQLKIVKGVTLGHQQSRIEARTTPRDADGHFYQCRNIMLIDNPMKRFHVGLFPAPDDPDPCYESFVYMVREIGSEAALQKLKGKFKNKRALYRSKLLEHEPDWWKPDQIWREVLNHIRSMGLFPNDIFQPNEELGAK